jgi:hypothetical protein
METDEAAVLNAINRADYISPAIVMPITSPTSFIAKNSAQMVADNDEHRFDRRRTNRSFF